MNSFYLLKNTKNENISNNCSVNFEICAYVHTFRNDITCIYAYTMYVVHKYYVHV